MKTITQKEEQHAAACCSETKNRYICISEESEGACTDTLFETLPQKMATITLIIVLIVSERSPDLSPLANGLLRFSEATVGAVVGIAAVWPVDRYRRWRQASAASSPKE